MIKLYNTLTRKKEEFRPIKDKQVGIYTCGPTVYNYVHIGNLRTYIFADLLRRVFKYNGYKINQVENITDVEDKIIRDSKKDKKDIYEFVKPYEKAFFLDMDALNIEKVEKYPKATDHIKEMIDMVQKLLDKKIAYKSKDGSVYFNISKFTDYGKLSGIDLSGIKEGARIDSDEYDKENASDFVLWKAKKEGEPSWEAPFGEGRPGWHIECSAMGMKYLGETFDIHTGAVDLVFPHHEDEIAQSEGVTGKKFVNYWIHGEHLLVEGRKMAKSLGNIYILKDLIKKGYNPLAFRLLCLQTHYRSKLNFTWKSLESAEEGLNGIYDFIRRLLAIKDDRLYYPDIPNIERQGGPDIEIYKGNFKKALNNDLDIPGALAVLQGLVNATNINMDRGEINKDQAKKTLDFLLEADQILGLNLDKITIIKQGDFTGDSYLKPEIYKLVKEREKARNKKDWKKADKLRQEILKKGYELEDTPKGPRWKKIR